MALTLTLISNAATRATRDVVFAGDEPIEAEGQRKAAAFGRTLRRVDTAVTSPALRARQTAAAMGLDAAIVADLRDIDLGAWSGLSLAEVHDANPAEVMAWTSDSSAAPHGGESVDAVLRRTGAWLQSLDAREGRLVAVTHAAILRAAVLVVLGATPISFWRIDVGPLCSLRLRGRAGDWTLLSLTSP